MLIVMVSELFVRDVGNELFERVLSWNVVKAGRIQYSHWMLLAAAVSNTQYQIWLHKTSEINLQDFSAKAHVDVEIVN